MADVMADVKAVAQRVREPVLMAAKGVPPHAPVGVATMLVEG